MTIESKTKVANTNRRQFLKKAGKTAVAAGAASTLAAPAVVLVRSLLGGGFKPMLVGRWGSM